LHDRPHLSPLPRPLPRRAGEGEHHAVVTGAACWCQAVCSGVRTLYQDVQARAMRWADSEGIGFRMAENAPTPRPPPPRKAGEGESRRHDGALGVVGVASMAWVLLMVVDRSYP